MSNTSTHSSTRRLTEGGICIALALVLSYLKIPIGLSFGGFGGSITLVMVPLILFAVRYGAPWGILAGVAFGTLKYFFAEGFAVSWVSIIFDYSVAYGAVGLAGLFRVKDNDYSKLPLAAFVGCVARFGIHFISGVTVYAQYMPGIHGHDHDVSRVLLRAVQRHVYAAEYDPRDRHLRVADEARSEAAERRVKK